MHPLFPIKTPGKHFYTETIYECTNMSMRPGYSIQDTRYKHLSENTRCDATAERGARFHPTVGSVTPNGFTTSHPRARPRCLRFSLLLPAQRKSRMKVTLLLLCSELPVFPELLLVFFRDPCRARSPPPFPHFLSCLFCKIVCGANSPIRGQVWELLRMGGSPPSPH
jgi:hypothetical protein